MSKPLPSSYPRHALARNLQMARTIFDWSQEEVGARCDLHRTHISLMEREALNVGVDTIERIAKAFGVAAYVLLMPPPDAQALLYQAFVDGSRRK
jgi:transcriptional regulator with XRE-family HTH domain